MFRVVIVFASLFGPAAFIDPHEPVAKEVCEKRLAAFKKITYQNRIKLGLTRQPLFKCVKVAHKYATFQKV